MGALLSFSGGGRGGRSGQRKYNSEYRGKGATEGEGQERMVKYGEEAFRTACDYLALSSSHDEDGLRYFCRPFPDDP